MHGPASAGFWTGLSIPRQFCVPYAGGTTDKLTQPTL